MTRGFESPLLTAFTDPATSLWLGTNMTSWYETRPFVNRFLQSSGITW